MLDSSFIVEACEKKIKLFSQTQGNKMSENPKENSQKRKATFSEDTVWIYGKCGPVIQIYRH